MKPILLKIINPIVLLLAVNQFATGFDPRLYGKNTFRFAHKQMAVVLLVALAAHLGLNYAWIRHTYFGKKQKPPQTAVRNGKPPAIVTGGTDPRG
jgi:hypothetical protein